MTKEQIKDQLADREYARLTLIQRREELDRKIKRVEDQIKTLKQSGVGQ